MACFGFFYCHEVSLNTPDPPSVRLCGVQVLV